MVAGTICKYPFGDLLYSHTMKPTPLLILGLLFLAGCSGRQVDGGELVLKPVTAESLVDEVRTVDSDLVVVNFWASWCLPCREEFPEFIRFHRESDPGDVQVRFVSVDFEEDLPLAAAFLREQGVTGTTFVKKGKEGPFISTISPQWSGGVPATAVFDRNGELLTFWEGKVTYDQLVQRVRATRPPS